MLLAINGANLEIQTRATLAMHANVVLLLFIVTAAAEKRF